MSSQLRRPSLAQIQARRLPYFHPDFRSLEEVCRVMDEWRGTDGCFLLRNSLRTPGGVSVSVWYRKRGFTPGLKHFTIKTFKGSFYLQDDMFDSLEKLVQFYATKKDVPNEEGLRGLRLSHPVPMHEYAEIPSNNDGYEQFVSRVTPALPPRKFSQPDRLSSCSDASSTSFSSTASVSSAASSSSVFNNDSDSAFEDDVQLPIKSSGKKGFFSSGGQSKAGLGEKRNKSTSDLKNKSRPLPAPPRMKSVS